MILKDIIGDHADPILAIVNVAEILDFGTFIVGHWLPQANN
jgi:hypothetical protein